MTAMQALLASAVQAPDPVVDIAGGSVTDLTVSPINAQVSITFNSDGSISTSANPAAGTWILPQDAAPDDYEIQYSVLSGDLPDEGILPLTWVALSTNRAFVLTRNSIGTAVGTWRFSIRKGAGAVLDTGDYVMTATVDSNN